VSDVLASVACDDFVNLTMMCRGSVTKCQSGVDTEK